MINQRHNFFLLHLKSFTIFFKSSYWSEIAEIVKRQNDKFASRYLHNSVTLRKTERETSTDGKTLIRGSSLFRDI